MAFEYTLIMIKGSEMSIEYLVDDDVDENEYVECGYDATNTHLYLVDKDGNEIEVNTDWSEEAPTTVTALNEERGDYVREVCWRTTEWDVKSDTPLTADSVGLVKRCFGETEFMEPTIPSAEMDFNSSWDGKWEQIVEGEQVYYGMLN